MSVRVRAFPARMKPVPVGMEPAFYYGHITGAISPHSPPACDVVWRTFLGAQTTAYGGEGRLVAVTPRTCELALGGPVSGELGQRPE